MNKVVTAGLSAMMAASALVAPVAAFAANGAHANGAHANGVQSGYEVYTTTDSAGTGAWADNDTDGNTTLDLSYSTEGGTWKDTPENGQPSDGDATDHNNGTYKVIIPTAIKYTGMKVGTVNTSDDYSIRVVGVLPAGKNVKLTAETGKTLTNGSDSVSTITETTSMGAAAANGAYSTTAFRTITPAEASVDASADATPSGTVYTDNIKMTGNVVSTGTFTGTVSYTASLV